MLVVPLCLEVSRVKGAVILHRRLQPAVICFKTWVYSSLTRESSCLISTVQRQPSYLADSRDVYALLAQVTSSIAHNICSFSLLCDSYGNKRMTVSAQAYHIPSACTATVPHACLQDQQLALTTMAVVHLRVALGQLFPRAQAQEYMWGAYQMLFLRPWSESISATGARCVQ